MSSSPDSSSRPLAQRVAGTIGWNIIDRVATQVLYAVTGVVLARMLSREDFGLVGAVLVFQAFASLFVDSGFSSALIQRKNPDRLDYSSVLWFNIAMAAAIYAILWFCSPLIADCFGGDLRLVPISRVMFLTFVINATAIVQTNRLMKRMDVRMIAVSNSLGLIAGAVVGITLAVEGFGPWAIVWQSVVGSTAKSVLLWATGRWFPMLRISWSALKSFFKVGMGVMGSSLLNTVFQNLYSFLIGNRVGLAPLGLYTQADKWSRMPVASLSQVLTASFLPALSRCQDSPRDFAAATSKMSRFTAWALFPSTILLAAMAEGLFHLLLGTRWDDAIPLFRLLLLRGVFTVLTSLYSCFILSLGLSRLLVGTELLRDVVAVVAIVVTFPIMGLSTPSRPVIGLEWMLWGQVLASAVGCGATLVVAARHSWRPLMGYIKDCLPYIAIAAATGVAAIIPIATDARDVGMLAMQLAAGLAAWLGLSWAFGSVVQRQAIDYALSLVRRPRRSRSASV